MMHEMRLPSEDGWEMENGWRVLVIGEMTVARGGTKDPGEWVAGCLHLLMGHAQNSVCFALTHRQLRHHNNDNKQPLNLSSASPTHTQSHNRTSLHGPLTPSHHSHSMNNRMHFGRMQTVNEPQKCTHREWD